MIPNLALVKNVVIKIAQNIKDIQKSQYQINITVKSDFLKIFPLNTAEFIKAIMEKIIPQLTIQDK